MFYYHDSTTYWKSKGQQKLQTCFTKNYDFVITNLLKMGQTKAQQF